jgi:hypothetical protein
MQKKKTGELKLFMDIWEERPHYCEISKKHLGEDFSVTFFSHILTKGAYPQARLDPENILLVSNEIHHLIEFSDRKDERLVKFKYQDLVDKLKQKYGNHDN